MKKMINNAIPLWIAVCLFHFSQSCPAQWTMVNDLPKAVGEIDPCVFDGKIYVFGGKIDGLYSSDTVWVFDPATGWSFGGKMPDSLEDVYVEAYLGKFYLFGGHSHPDFVYRREVMTYDPLTQAFDTVAVMPSSRAFFCTAVLNDKIYLIGGDDNVAGATNTVDIFDPVGLQWSVGPPMATKRIVLSADTLGGKIYVTGGGSPSGVALNSMEIYDPVTTKWTTSPANMHYERGFHACKNVNGKIFIMGGTISTSVPITNSVEYFDPQLGQWVDFEPMLYNRRKLGAAVLGGNTLYVIAGGSDAAYFAKVEKYEVPASGWVYKRPVPTGRAYCTGSVLDGKIYVIGGAYSKTQTSNAVEAYDPVTDTWESKTPLPEPVLGASAQTIGGKIYVVGGQNVYLNTSKNTLYIYDPVMGNWTTGPPMPTPRGYLSSATTGGKLYAIGGTTNYPTRTDKVEMYDPAINKWTTLSPMSFRRSALSCEVLDGKIYAIGGVDVSGYYKAVEVYDTATGIWTTVKEMPQTRALFGSGVINGALCVYGGVLDDVTVLFNTIQYQHTPDEWIDLPATMPEYKAAFASPALGGCVYGIGGATYAFYFDNIPGPKVSSTVLKYCPETVDVADPEEQAPMLLQNFPNPFHSTTRIAFTVKEHTRTLLDILDINGRFITTLVDETLPPGRYEVVWNGSGQPAGVYFCRLRASGFTATGKCVLQPY